MKFSYWVRVLHFIRFVFRSYVGCPLMACR